MGGRGSSYYENKNALIEKLMRSMNITKNQTIIKEDPESQRTDYPLFEHLKNYGISTRQSTDACSLEKLEIHQMQLYKLSKKYQRLTNVISMEKEIQFSQDNRKNAYGYLVSGELVDGRLFTRLALSDIVINNNKLYIMLKRDAIKKGQSVKVDDNKINIYTSTHEFGHLLEENIIRKRYNSHKNKGLDYNLFKEVEASRIKNEVVKIYKTRYNNDDIYLSTYANQGGDFEWFAETFTNLELSSKPAPIAETLGDYLRSQI